MENTNPIEVSERIVIKISVPTEDAQTLGIFAKRYPHYGIRIHIRENDDFHKVSKIEVHQSNVSKAQANSNLIHFMLGYAKEF
jgi:hypothetical protein